jgi:DNA-binding NarL/FixJ family response regulator
MDPSDPPQWNTGKVERNQAIWKRRQEGATYKAIGAEFGIAAQTVEKLCRKAAHKDEVRARRASGTLWNKPP